jgi:hypothetical protein
LEAGDRNRNKRINLSARNGQQDGARNERRTLSARNWQGDSKPERVPVFNPLVHIFHTVLSRNHHWGIPVQMYFP